jgi:hypothetical protein
MAIILAAFMLTAKPPVRFMYPTTLGVEYYGAMRGQLITKALVKSHERIQMVYLSFAPIEYLQVGLGLGADRFFTDEFDLRRFDGRYGFSPALSLTGNTPAFLKKMLRATLTVDFRYFNCKDKFKYRYSGPILDPSIGLLLHAGPFADVELGAKGHLIGGVMENNDTDSKTNFSNAHNVRGYLALTLASRKGAFMQLHFDASPAMTTEFDRGPDEATIGFCIGFLMTPDRTNRKIQEKTSKYFPAFNEMKKKEDEMSDEIE